MKYKATKSMANAARLFVASLAMAATGTAAAVAKPLAVWNGDFPISGSSERGACTLYLNSNTSDGAKVTISGDSEAHGLGVAIASASQTTTIAAVAGISGLAAAESTNPRILASVSTSDSDCRINLGLPSNSATLTGYTSSISSSASYASYTFDWPDSNLHYFGFMYDAKSGTTYYGTMGFVDGSLSANTYYQASGLVYGNDKANALYIGGIFKNGWNTAGTEISFLALLDTSWNIPTF